MQAAEALVARGNKTALVRTSDGGCAMAAKNGAAVIRPVAVEVVDKTGGGDAFAGALAVALIEKQEALDAARFAVAAAHVSVTRYGAQPSFPARGELEQMLARITYQEKKRNHKEHKDHKV
jgi:ribokinase